MKMMLLVTMKVVTYKGNWGGNHPTGKGQGRDLQKGQASVEEGPTHLRVGEPGAEEPGVEGSGVEGPGAQMVGKGTLPVVVPLVVKLKVRRILRRLLILVLTFQMKSTLSLPLPHFVNLGFT